MTTDPGSDAIEIHESPAGLSIAVQVHPRSGANKVRGIHDGRLKLAIDAAPVEGEATRQCLRFMADLLGVANSRVKLLSGAQSRKKIIFIEGISRSDCLQILKKHLQKG